MLGTAVVELLLAWSTVSGNIYSHIRTTEDRVHVLLDYGCHHSATFRGLVAHLEASDVIVYVRTSPAVSGDSKGRTMLLATAGGHRYLVVSLSDCLSFEALVGLLGHELQHAVEIADARGVVDEATLISFYQRVGTGRRAEKGRWMFETDAASEAGHRVIREMPTRARATERD
jgi:hypothetical protein